MDYLKLNFYQQNKIPFFFLIDFDKNIIDVIRLNNLPSNIKYSINKYKPSVKKIEIIYQRGDYFSYKKKFKDVINEIKRGNVYLLNLTTKTKISINSTLKDIFNNSNAKYKLFYKNRFVSFSPESFIKIKNNKIYTYPMKGTIEVKPCAKEKILNDKKEFAEHIMVVDLLRNDLNMVSSGVKVVKFRYIDKIKTNKKNLYQVSSEIVGELDNNYKLSDIFEKILPAGSISGTPKKSAINIINRVEKYKRGYYTGIWGVFDGKNLDSAVIIRYIEKDKNKLFYKSGGGITIDSDIKKEYQEIYNKIYIPR